MLKKLAEKTKTAYSNYKKLHLIGIDYGETGGDHTAVTKISVNQATAAGEALRKMSVKFSVNEESLESAMLKTTERLQEILNKINRRKTNNWRKMHGLPMRRKRSRQKKKIDNGTGGGNVGNKGNRNNYRKGGTKGDQSGKSRDRGAGKPESL